MTRIRRRLEKFYDQYHQELYTYAISIVHRRELAEDAIHDVFFRLLGLDHEPENLKVYVFTSVRNAAIDLLRKESRPIDTERIEIFQSVDTPRDQYAERQFQERVSLGLNQLSADERETILHYLYAELTFKEIAEVRQSSINTVMSWYRRGMEKLRKFLEE